MLYLTCTTITSVDLAHYGVSRAKDWVSVYCGTKLFIQLDFIYTRSVLNDTKLTNAYYCLLIEKYHVFT